MTMRTWALALATATLSIAGASRSIAAEKAKYALVKIDPPDKKIERLWKSKCGACHGADGKAETEKGKSMQTSDMSQASWQTAKSDEELKVAIEKGVKWVAKDGTKQEMDGYAGDLKPEQIDALVKYTRWVGAPK